MEIWTFPKSDKLNWNFYHISANNENNKSRSHFQKINCMKWFRIFKSKILVSCLFVIIDFILLRCSLSKRFDIITKYYQMYSIWYFFIFYFIYKYFAFDALLTYKVTHFKTLQLFQLHHRSFNEKKIQRNVETNCIFLTFLS